MALSPDDAIQVIRELTETLKRTGRISTGTLVLMGVMLLASTVFFAIGAYTHAVHTEALRVLIERSK